MRSTGELVAEFSRRLKQMCNACKSVAGEEGATFRESESPGNPFSKQISVDEGTTPLPEATMTKGSIKVQIRQNGIHQNNLSGKYYGVLSVRREIVGQGHPGSPSCWTDLENAEDVDWYADPAWQKKTRVGADLIKTWLYHSGPPPIY
jgi:hypothetical protein